MAQGIFVDHQLRTSDPAIFAIGDCAQVLGKWQPYIAPIMHGGKALAKVLAGDSSVQVSYPVMPVIAKTPLCKVVVVVPDITQLAHCRLEVDSSNSRAFIMIKMIS